MKKSGPILILAILLAIVAFWWFSPANVLKRRTKELFSTAEVPASMSDLARNTRGPNLAKFIAPTLEIAPPDTLRNPIGTSITRDTVAGSYSAIAKFCRRISLENPEFDSVEIEGEAATVTLRVDALVELSDRRPVDGIQHMTLDWVKSSEGWQLKRAAWTESGR